MTRFLLAISALLFLAACTRPTVDSSSVSIALPSSIKGPAKTTGSNKAEAVTTYSTFSHALINISGPGMQTISRTWSLNDLDRSLCTGNVCTIENVPTGKDRVVQVLAIYEDSNSSMLINYGDTTKELSAATTEVDIKVTAIQTSGVDPIETQIRGRFIPASGPAPSGQIDIYLKAKADKPEMYFGASEMHKGWFSAFGIRGVKFDYRMNGLSLFGGFKGVEEISNTTNTSQILVKWPERYEQQNSAVRKRPAEDSLFGFFGPGVSSVSGHRVCYTPTSVTSFNYKFVDNAMTTALQYDPTSSNVALARLDLTGRVGGNSCPSVSDSTPISPTELRINPLMQGEGHLPAPFDSLGGNAVNVMGTTATTALLPGITPSDIPSLSAFFVPENELESKYRLSGPGDLFRCNEINTASANPASNVEAAGSSPFNGTNPISITLTRAVPSGKALLVCPAKPAGLGGGFYLGAVRAYGGMMSGNYMMLSSDDGSVGYVGMNMLFTKNACHPVRFKLYQGMGVDHFANGNVSVNLPAAGDLQFYSDSNCTTSQTAAVISNGQKESGVLYAKATNVFVSMSLPSITVTGDSVMFDGTGTFYNSALPKFRVDTATKWMADKCYKVDVQAQYANGMMYNQPSNVTTAMGFSGSAGLASSEATCSSGTFGVSPTIYSGTAYLTYWTRTSSTGTSNFVMSAPDFQSFMKPVEVLAAATPDIATYLNAQLEGALEVGKCVPLRLSLVNASGAEVIARTYYPITLTSLAGLGAISTDPRCEEQNFPAVIPANSSFTYVYIQPFTTGNIDIKSLLPAYAAFDPVAAIPTSQPVNSATAQISLTGIPNFSSKVIGGHEFGASRGITVALNPSGMTISCSEYDAMASKWIPCTSSSVTNTNFNWTRADAIAGKKFRLFASTTGNQAEMVFDPKSIYGKYFEVIGCDHEVTSNTTTSALNSIIASNAHVCLASAVQVSCDGTPISLSSSAGEGRSLIGHSSKNVFNNNGINGTVCVSAIPTSTANNRSVIANLNFTLNPDAVCSSGIIKAISATGGAPTAYNKLDILNNMFALPTGANCEGRGISITGNNGNFGALIANNSFNVTGSSLFGPTGVFLDTTNAGTIDYDSNSYSAASSYDNYAISIDRNGGSPGALAITNSFFNGQKMVVLRDYNGASGTDSPGTTIDGNKINVLVDPNLPVISFSRGISHTVKNNTIEYNSSNANWGFLGIKTLGQTSMMVRIFQNRVIRAQKDHFISANIDSGTTLNMDFTQNSFMSTSSVGATSMVFFYLGSGTANVITADASSPNGNNFICHTNTTYGWSGTTMMGSGPVASTTASSVAAQPSKICP